MAQWERRVVLLTLTAFLLLVAYGVPARVYAAAGEIYALTPSPGRVQETYTPGVSLILSVTNATSSKTYSFTWHVTDSSGVTTSATNSTTTSATQTSFVLSLIFPRSFGLLATTKYVGNYSVTVDQTSPTPVRLGVATCTFVVGLTDSISYQRTAPVSIKATSYKNGETVTISFFSGSNPVPYNATLQTADFTGNVTYVWTPPPSTPLGNNTVTIQGTSPGSRKTPPDSQSFWIYPTNVTISQLIVTPSSAERTQLIDFSFSATYPSGVSVQSGSGSLLLTESDGKTTHLISAYYNSARGEFNASYRPLLSSGAGAWVATVSVDSVDDGYGNVGPPVNVVRGFTVQPASLTVSAFVTNNVYGPGDLVPIYATIMGPDNSVIASGTVTGVMTYSGQQIGSRVSLAYDPSQSKWVGTYTVPSTGPSGVWFVQVEASDNYSNSGQGSTTAVVSIASVQSALFSFWFFSLVVVLTVGLVTGFMFWKRRGIFRAVLKVDLEAVSQEAKKVESQDFFRNIQDQLKREKATEGKDDA